MNRPYEIIREAEIHLDEFIEYQIEFGPTNDYGRIARYSTGSATVLKCAAILYPTYILVEDQVVLKNKYSDENWRAWRERLNARDSANLLNHVHINDFLLGNDYKWELNDRLGEMLAFFWQMAVKHQFPNHNVTVEYVDGIVDTLNR